jgi:DNA-directed RNA polymerase subunit alpha
LSQLTGTAIPLVEISGASHEYETLTGVRESVLDIILNIKQIILTSDFEFSTGRLFLVSKDRVLFVQGI